MSARVNPSLLHEIKRYGAISPESCFNCGNCTAICPLTTSDYPFPRRTIRLIQLGLWDKLLSSSDPWLCYFCGDCSATCPRGAEPSETMMATRRWLIAQYDRSGKAAELYTAKKTLAWTMARVALLPLALLLTYHLLTGGRNVITERVALNTFAPVWWVWGLVLVHFAYLGSHVVRNSVYMSRLIMGPETNLLKIPLRVYAAGL